MQATTRFTGRTTMAKLWAAAEGNLIRGLREERGLTQAELAALVGMENRQAVCKVETARCHVPAFRLEQFAEALRVDLRALGLALLRVQHPFFYAAIQGADAQLAGELRRAMSTMGQPHKGE